MSDAISSANNSYIMNNTTYGTTYTEGSSQVYDAVFTDENEQMVEVDDFLSLMVAQLQNQDFMNPVDDTQYVTQMAQFATMTSMQELSSFMETNHVLSLVGKTITASKFTVSGDLDTETGIVQKVSLLDNEYTIYVNDTAYSLSQIMEYHSSDSTDSSTENNESDDTTSDDTTTDTDV